MNNRDYVKGLRDFADWLEANPDYPELNKVNGFTFVYNQDELRDCAKKLGQAEKGWGTELFTLTKAFGPVEFRTNIFRERLCERVVTKKVIPAHTVEAQEAYEVPERTEETVEWQCPEEFAVLSGGEK